MSPNLEPPSPPHPSGLSQSTSFECPAICIKLAATAESFQLCPTLCNPIDGSPPGCPVPGILQAKTLEWAAISFSSAWKWNVKVKSLSCVQPSATPWTAAFQAPPSMGFSRQEYWSGVPLPSPIKLALVIYFICGNIQVSMLFSQIIPPSLSPTESTSLFFTSVSLLLSHIQSHCYHLSKFHIYVLIYCIGAFFSDLLHSV